MGRWVLVGNVSDFVEGEPILHDFEYETAALFRIGDKVYAIEDRCTHDDGPLADGEFDATTCEISCPRHGARFDVTTGKALSMPASEDVPTYPVKIEDGSVFVEEPEE